MQRLTRMSCLAIAGLLLPACGSPGEEVDDPQTSGPGAHETERLRWQTDLEADFASYSSWAVIGEHLRWSPLNCRMAPPPSVRRSASGDEDTHGRKLYALFAALPDPYLDRAVMMPVGQVLVKEAWVPEEVPVESVPREYSEEAAALVAARGSFPFHVEGSTAWHAGALHGLFVMRKYPPDTPGTDQGWLYATLDAAGRITEAGRIQSCIDCHSGAGTTDRCFGPE